MSECHIFTSKRICYFCKNISQTNPDCQYKKHNKENEYTEIGKRIRAWRKAAKLTGEKLGESLEINKQTLSNYETAKTKIPIPVMIKAADFFGKSLDELITGEALRPRFQIVEKKSVLQTTTCDSCREGPPEWNAIGSSEKLILEVIKKGDPELIHELADVILKRRAKPEGLSNGMEGQSSNNA